ncbi:P-loop containing nucleoside triphosphate hydrolase protein [Rhypophila decipiens]
MDYHARHGYDESSFDLPSTHRLPTISAAEALEELDGSDKLQSIPTRLAALDDVLGALPGCAGSTVDADLNGLGNPGAGGGGGGIQKGEVTEIWGPPGVGKTSFGLQLAASCLRDDGGVVWVDGFHRLPVERLQSTVGPAQDGLNERFIHYTCPSLAHFIALLCRPTATCIPAGTSLIVVDALSALLNHAFPMLDTREDANSKGGKKGPSKPATRLQVLQYIVGGLQKLAATRNAAIVILTQCATKMQADRGSTLIPAINASIWEQGISTRLVLFHDWVEDGENYGPRHLRFVGVQKLHGKASDASMDDVCAFEIRPSGLVSVEYDNTQTCAAFLSTPAPKRKLVDTDFEIPDSDDDEDYGWQIDDEDLPPNPSQWQGSEDLLLAPQQSDDEAQDDNEVEDPVAEEPEVLEGGESGDEL